MLKALSVKTVPRVAWSSPQQFSFKPRLPTLFWLCFGLTLFGLGEACLIAAGAGVSPWTVLAQGIGLQLHLTIGWATFVCSLLVLFLWVPLKQLPGLGTILNAVIISAAIGLSLPYLPNPNFLPLQLLEVVVGILLVGLGSGLYLVAQLGPGPRDGLMTGLQRVTDLPIAWVRMAIEVSVVLLGWLLGGTFGAGTLLFAIGIGWSVSLGLYLVGIVFTQQIDAAPEN
ncbi:MAG: hypothetical protein RKH07_12100 [Gammaproteobacteria bacterium]